MDSSGVLKFRIEIPTPFEPLTQKDKNDLIDRRLKRQEEFHMGEKLTKNEMRKSFIFPEYKPFFSGFNQDDQGRIYVRRFKYETEDEKIVYDVFNHEGDYLYKLASPHYLGITKNGYTYRYGHDAETSLLQVIIYKIINWDKIKNKVNR